MRARLARSGLPAAAALLRRAAALPRPAAADLAGSTPAEALRCRLTLGDMRLPHVLRQAGVERVRSVLLLGSESTENFEAALQEMQDLHPWYG